MAQKTIPDNNKQNFSSFSTHYGFKWCPGCGNFSILNTMKFALLDLNIPQHMVQVVSDIGQNGKMPMWLNVYGFHGLHGRALPLAQGIKVANPKLTVLVNSGDGGAYAEGLGHFVAACRRNVNLTYLVHDNLTYGLTTGQASPTTVKGTKTQTTPEGKLVPAINPLQVAISSGATFVARVFTGEQAHFQEVLKKAIAHKGFALVDILQPCVIWNKEQTWQSWEERVYPISEETHDKSDLTAAHTLAARPWADKIPIGIFYQEKNESSFEEKVATTVKLPLVDRNLNNVNIKPHIDLLLGKRSRKSK